MVQSMQKQRTRFLLALLTFWLLPWVGDAATITTALPLGSYDRILFTGNAPQTMRVEASGNTVILNLSEATGDVGVLTARLKPHVVGVEKSADGKRITLTLDKPYRTRQFVSGNSVGLDILTTGAMRPASAKDVKPAPITTTKPVEQAPSSIMTTKKEPAPTPATAPVVAPKPTPAPVVEKKPEPSPILTTKKEAPSPAPIVEAKPEPTPIPKPVPLLSTKEEPKAALTTKEEPKPAPVAEVKPEPVAIPEVQPEQAEEEFFDKAPAQPAAKADAPKPVTPPPTPTNSHVAEDLLVGVRTEKDGATIDFPWTERVASAVFQRGRDIWIVFNKESRLDALRLRTILPTSVLNITRYKMPGNTVLKLETNGMVNASVDNKKGSYAWSVRLSPDPISTAKDTPLQINADHVTPHLLFQVFDTGVPFSFYDPSIGDRWIVTPLYEVGLGIQHKRSFPAFDVMASAQGIAVLTQKPEIGFQPTRVGLRLTSPMGLDISKDLPYLSGTSAPIKGASAVSNVLLPYDRWYVPPSEFFKVRAGIMESLTTAPTDTRPQFLTQLANMYLGQGMGLEAASLLDMVKRSAPEYFAENKLALAKAAANFMAHHMEDAALDIKSPELESLPEAQLWKDVISLSTPLDIRVTGAVVSKDLSVPESDLTEAQKQKQAEDQLKQIAANAALKAKGFDYLEYDGRYIQFYPPAIRQRLAIEAAVAYIDRSKYGHAVKAFDSLNKEGLLEPIQLEAELLLGRIAAEKEKFEEARNIWERLANQESNQKVRAHAAYSLAKLDYTSGKINADEAIERIDGMRISWRGDRQERELLDYLGQLYLENKQFDMALRVWKELVNQFPSDPEAIKITTRTAELFERLFYDGQADELPPIKALALFYEFRELTPIGEKGNAIIQKLADRLAAVDLIDRAAQLLEHQIKFRLAGEERAKVGARLALLYLIDREPEKALNTLEITNYGDMSDALRFQRLRLSAQAMASMERLDEALAIMTADQTDAGQMLRLDILWKMKDWANVINQAEDMMAARKDLTAPLSEKETEVLLKLALAYSFEKDFTQLNYLRDYYTSLMSDSPYKDIFSYITNNTAPIDPEDFALVTQQISRTESFMKEFRNEISKGKLSQTVP